MDTSRYLIKRKRAIVRVHFRPQNWTHPEPHSVPVEQFLAMLRFERWDNLAELPIDLNRSGRDDLFSIHPFCDEKGNIPVS